MMTRIGKEAKTGTRRKKSKKYECREEQHGRKER
jgi:hypothetical protein